MGDNFLVKKAKQNTVAGEVAWINAEKQYLVPGTDAGVRHIPSLHYRTLNVHNDRDFFTIAMGISVGYAPSPLLATRPSPTRLPCSTLWQIPPV